VYDFVDSLDYEVELGVILGRDAFRVSKEEALSYVMGYTIINDVSARNVQRRHQQWYLGKSLDGYTPMGPCIVTADEIGDIHDLDISCYVNDEKRQSSNTSYMITTVEEAIAELSRGMTLKAGTIIATGTPGGVAMGMNPPKFLKEGDVVRCEISGIGQLVNTVG
jgi:2-keto-4-pentenoate hydratase/2-oxohepta-3-ene-1,7-dioic acid hydratase in catechol pathway